MIPPHRMRLIIFLDIDGVIATPETVDASNFWTFTPHCVEQLRRILTAHPTAEVVISSSWRKATVDETKAHLLAEGLDAAIVDRITGITVRGYSYLQKGVAMSIPRGVEIRQWIPGNTAPAPCRQPRPAPTHEVLFWWKRDHRRENNELVGRTTCDWNDTADHLRITRLKLRMYNAMQADYMRLQVDLRPMASLRERRTMDNLQRFRRKMGMVLREFEKRRAEAINLQHGIPEFALQDLDQQLEEAWQQAERIYGCKREQYHEN